MIHGDMNFSRLMVYAKSFEECKLCMIFRNLKRYGTTCKTNIGTRRRIQFKMNLGVVRSKLRRLMLFKVVSRHVLLLGEARWEISSRYWEFLSLCLGLTQGDQLSYYCG